MIWVSDFDRVSRGFAWMLALVWLIAVFVVVFIGIVWLNLQILSETRSITSVALVSHLLLLFLAHTVSIGVAARSDSKVHTLQIRCETFTGDKHKDIDIS